jgi:hypothetical protein
MHSPAPPTRLIAACCRRLDDPGRPAAIAEHIGAVRVWEAFPDLVRRHRVHPQTLAALKGHPAVPDSVITTLDRRAKALRLRGLRQLAELLRATALLRDAGIPVAEIKGITLGVLAYGTAENKESVDLDLLVPPEAGREALQLLLAHGYRHKRAGTGLTADQIRALVRNRKDVGLLGPGKAKLELHWGLNSGTGLLEGAGETLAWQDVAVAPGRSVSTLAMPDLVAYLAVHGSLHDWARIKWLADFDALFRKAAPADRAAWMEHAGMLGADRWLRHAIAVAERVIAPYDEAASNAAAQDFAAQHETRRVLDRALRCMEAPYPAPRENLRQKLAGAREELATKLPLFGRLIDARLLLRPYLFVEEDILRFPLPDRLRYLYPLMRGFIWAAGRMFRGRRATVPA